MDNEILPTMYQWCEKDQPPHEIYKKMGQAGYFIEKIIKSMRPFLLIFATLFLSSATATTTISPLPLSASVQFSGAVLQDLLALPLPALQQLTSLLQVPSTTGGCSTGLDGGQMVSWLKWGQRRQRHLWP